MNDKEKKEILRLLLQNSDLQTSSASRLKKYLETHGFTNEVSLPTLNKYKTKIKNMKYKYDNSVVFDPHCNDEKIMNDIIKELSRNRERIKERENYRNNIHNELLKYNHKFNDELSLNQNNVSKQNEILKRIKRDICLKFKHIPQKTLNYLYNDEAKELGLLPKRSTVSSKFIDEIDKLFKDGVIQKYILDKHTTDKSIVQMVQDYIEENYNTKLSLSVIQRYFQKYFKTLKFELLYESISQK